MLPILIASFKDQEILETVNEQSLPVLYGSLLWLSVLEEQITTCRSQEDLLVEIHVKAQR